MNLFINMLKRFKNSERAQGMVEYGLILTLVSVVAISSLTGIGGKINDTFDKVHDGSELFKSYTVRFEDFDGSEIKTVKVVEGESATAPEVAIREGYKFIGWNNTFDNVVGDLTITAEYEINTYKVTFVDKSGKILSNETVNHGDNAISPQLDTTKSKYFNGYEWDKSYENVKSDLTIVGEYGGIMPAYNDYTLVSTPQDLQNVQQNISSNGRYLQINDIDMSNFGNFTPISNSWNGFYGEYDGAGFVIKNLTVNHPYEYAGLFGKVDGRINNIGLVGVSVNGNTYTGGIAGLLNYTGTITNSYVTGTVHGTGQSDGNADGAGGLVGFSRGKITNSYSTGNVTGSRDIGGLVGNLQGGEITNSYSTGRVSGSSSVGGFVGYYWGGIIDDKSAWAKDVNSLGFGYRHGSSNAKGMNKSEIDEIIKSLIK